MKPKLVALGIVTMLSMVSIPMLAHDQFYVQGNAGLVVRVFFAVTPTDNWRGDPNRLFFGCGDGNDPAFNLSFGGVCFGNATDGNFAGGGSHLVGTSTEVIPGVFMDASTITAVDDQFQSTLEATWCQDINGDGFCGGNATDVLDSWREEPAYNYCGATTVYSPMSDITTGPAAPTFNGWRSNGSASDSWGYQGDGVTTPPRGNWDVSKEGLIFLSAVAQGAGVRASISGGPNVGPYNNVCGNTVVTDPNGNPVATVGPMKWATKGFVEHA